MQFFYGGLPDLYVICRKSGMFRLIEILKVDIITKYRYNFKHKAVKIMIKG